MKSTNKTARPLVQNKQPFVSSNIYGIHLNNAYVVFSYGLHYPMFVHTNGKWFENSDKYSVTTSKHKSQLHPLVETEKKTTKELKALLKI
jgi:hypothetical protein